MAGFTFPQTSIQPGLNALAQGLQMRQERNDRNSLAQALPALSGDSSTDAYKNALATVARINPDAAFQLQQQSAKTAREQQAQLLKWGAGMIAGAQTPEAKAQVWAQVAPQIKALGGVFANVPDQYDDSVDAVANSILERFPKETGPLKVNAGDRLVDPVTLKEVYAAPDKTPEQPGEVKEYKFYQEQGGKLPFFDWQKALKSAGASSVSVNTGQKGFDNELKIRSDFRSEPIYKVFQETDSAYRQIISGLDAKSPAGDLQAATKLMKLFDPTSVVRESELGMAMAATGAIDRISNYVQLLSSGQKLTPQQREDFRQVATKVHDDAKTMYDAKADEYEGIAKDYQMNPERVTGRKKPPAAPVQIKDDAGYASLPPGTEYIAPDGTHRRKK